MKNIRYAPDAKITLAGDRLPGAMRASVSSISVQRGIEGADRLELRIANENLRWLDHPRLALGNELRLELGYAPDPLEQVFVGDIVGQSPNFPADGVPTLTVVAHDRRERLQRGTKKRWFAIAVDNSLYPLPDAAIAAGVAGEHRLLLLADPVSFGIAAVLGGVGYAAAAFSTGGQQQLVRKQEAESDLDFIARIALENGWLMTVDHAGDLGGNVLRFTSQLANKPPDLTLRYGESLIEFHPRYTRVGEVLRVAARFWVPSKKLELTVAVGWDWERQALSVSVVPSGGLPSGLGALPDGSAESNRELELASKSQGPTLTLAGHGINAATASRAILGKLVPKLNQRLTGSGSTIGDLRLCPGGVVSLEGIGTQFGGLYRVTSVTHTLDAGGFRSAFDVRKEVWLDGGDLLRALDPRAHLANANPARALGEVLR